MLTGTFILRAMKIMTITGPVAAGKDKSCLLSSSNFEIDSVGNMAEPGLSTPGSFTGMQKGPPV